MCQKFQQRKKNKVKFEKSTIQLVLKSCETFAENHFNNFVFP